MPEAQQDAVTALSGSGPAYFFFLVEAMIDAGILLGLPRAVSTELIIQSAVGAATMLRDSGEHPVTLREAVTSPGGTTIAAIRELENHGCGRRCCPPSRRPQCARPNWARRTNRVLDHASLPAAADVSPACRGAASHDHLDGAAASG